MSMHFEREKEDASGYSVTELRTDTRLAARLIATRDGLTIDIADGFEVELDDNCRTDMHLAFRERES